MSDQKPGKNPFNDLDLHYAETERENGGLPAYSSVVNESNSLNSNSNSNSAVQAPAPLSLSDSKKSHTQMVDGVDYSSLPEVVPGPEDFPEVVGQSSGSQSFNASGKGASAPPGSGSGSPSAQWPMTPDEFGKDIKSSHGADRSVTPNQYGAGQGPNQAQGQAPWQMQQNQYGQGQGQGQGQGPSPPPGQGGPWAQGPDQYGMPQNQAPPPGPWPQGPEQYGNGPNQAPGAGPWAPMGPDQYGNGPNSGQGQAPPPGPWMGPDRYGNGNGNGYPPQAQGQGQGPGQGPWQQGPDQYGVGPTPPPGSGPWSQMGPGAGPGPDMNFQPDGTPMQMPMQMPLPQDRIIAIPAVDSAPGSPLLRAYIPMLNNYNIPPGPFFKFLDSLNEVIVSSPPMQVLDVTGGILKSVPILFPLHWIGSAFTGLANMNHKEASKGKSDLAIKTANKEFFASHGLKAELANLDALAYIAKIPILDAQGKIDKKCPLIREMAALSRKSDGAAKSAEDSAPGQVDVQVQRLALFRPWIADAELDVKPWGAKSKMTRFNSALKKYNGPRRDRDYKPEAEEKDRFRKSLWLVIREVDRA